MCEELQTEGYELDPELESVILEALTETVYNLPSQELQSTPIYDSLLESRRRPKSWQPRRRKFDWLKK